MALALRTLRFRSASQTLSLLTIIYALVRGYGMCCQSARRTSVKLMLNDADDIVRYTLNCSNDLGLIAAISRVSTMYYNRCINASIKL